MLRLGEMESRSLEVAFAVGEARARLELGREGVLRVVLRLRAGGVVR